MVVIDSQKISGQPRDAGLGKDRRERLELLIGVEHRAADETIEVGAAGDKRVELIEIFFDGVDSLIVEGELE